MKKLLLSVYLISAMAFFGYSQNLTLSDIHGPIAANSTIIQSGTPDSVELITYLNVKNIGGSALNVLCKKVEFTMIDSAEITMCWAGLCYPASTFVSPNAQLIDAGQTNTEFIAHYTQIAYNHFKPGESVVRWVFYDRSNVNDSVSVTIKYTTFPLGIEEANTRQAMISNAFPNPANTTASFNYAIPSGSQGKIIIRNLIGSTVQTEQVPSFAGKMTINTSSLSDGIYFYSLMLDGKISQTKKLVVKH
jgi:hypothetical protein